MYNENYLTFDDEMELEDAGLDVDELADMDWDDRYDAIDEAGLNPLDYEYGFLNDEYPKTSASAATSKKETQESHPNTHSIRHKKSHAQVLSKRDQKKIRKAIDEVQDTLDALWVAGPWTV